MLEPKVRKDLADRARYIIKRMDAHVEDLTDTDKELVAQLYDMAHHWFPAPPHTWQLFECAPKGLSYKFYCPNAIMYTPVAKSFLRACINTTSLAGEGGIGLHSTPYNHSLLVWCEPYDYEILITAHKTDERGVYEMVVNVYE